MAVHRRSPSTLMELERSCKEEWEKLPKNSTCSMGGSTTKMDPGFDQWKRATILRKVPASLFEDADFIFQQDLAPAHTAKSTKSWLNDHGVGVLDWPANSPDLNPVENLWGIVKRKMRNKRPKNADELKATVKETCASIPPQQCHKLITSMPRPIEAVIKAKGASTKY
ncbi:hypothetical protein QTP70_013390 [Hemibagrus guttatus]|uniref:Tc1-like transposase DDE domain-containing protein n=1 Tax=Hemibagrus guttatus TaxID=175788 RepID=A0AAE0RB76_9TELE|nr:hypothetical protein QTP70_013390 [Hemibagrus guttatus]